MVFTYVVYDPFQIQADFTKKENRGMADGVRLTAPTILLTEPSAPRTSSSAHLPRGALLAVGSSGGRRLVCALGDGLQHLPPALGAELPELLLPKPALCGRPLDLSVGAHRLVGHPLI